MYGTNNVEAIRPPVWDARVKRTTVRRPRNTKRDKRADSARATAALDALYAGQPQSVTR
jgi:hypothetical protein